MGTKQTSRKQIDYFLLLPDFVTMNFFYVAILALVVAASARTPTLVSLDKNFTGSHLYEDPNPTGTCSTGELDVQVTGLSGSFCSPACSQSSPCPDPSHPAGVTAQSQCVLVIQGSQT